MKVSRFIKYINDVGNLGLFVNFRGNLSKQNHDFTIRFILKTFVFVLNEYY